MRLARRNVLLVCGILMLVLGALCIWFYLRAANTQKQKWGSIVCRVNVTILSLACSEHAEQHGNTLPTKLSDLRPYLPTALQRLRTRSLDPYLKVWEAHGGPQEPFACPLARGDIRPAYETVGAGRKIPDGNRSEISVIREIEPNHNRNRGLYIGYLEGHIVYMDKLEWASALKR